MPIAHEDAGARRVGEPSDTLVQLTLQSLVVGPLSTSASVDTVCIHTEHDLQEGRNLVNTPHHIAIAEDAHSRLSRHRRTLHEQLCFFGAANEARPAETSVGSWAALALALVIVPWAVLALMIWMLT